MVMSIAWLPALQERTMAPSDPNHPMTARTKAGIISNLLTRCMKLLMLSLRRRKKTLPGYLPLQTLLPKRRLSHHGWGPELCTATAHLVRPWLKPAGPAGRGLPLAADPLLPLPGGLPAHGPGPAGAHPCTPLHSRAHPLIPPKSYTPPYIPYGRLSASRAHFAGLSTGYRSKAAAPQSALLPRR